MLKFYAQISDNTYVEQDPFQSLGNCSGQCRGKAAFAIVQGNSCWCSDYAPADTVPVSGCSDDCPGYPYESCGSSGEGLYGYFRLDGDIKGTMGPSKSSTNPTSKVSVLVMHLIHWTPNCLEYKPWSIKCDSKRFTWASSILSTAQLVVGSSRYYWPTNAKSPDRRNRVQSLCHYIPSATSYIHQSGSH